MLQFKPITKPVNVGVIKIVLLVLFKITLKLTEGLGVIGPAALIAFVANVIVLFTILSVVLVLNRTVLNVLVLEKTPVLGLMSKILGRLNVRLKLLCPLKLKSSVTPFAIKKISLLKTSLKKLI